MKNTEKSVTNPLNKSLPSQLKICRESAGLSLRQVAKQVNKSPAAVSKWESGQTTPYGETLLKLCKIYKVDITAFYGVATQEEQIRLTPSEIELIQLYRNTAVYAKKTIKTILETCQK